jgi:hypothetical protein
MFRLGLMTFSMSARAFLSGAVVVSAACFTLASPTVAKSSSTVSLGHFGDWKAYRYTAKGAHGKNPYGKDQAGKDHVSCFMVSAPVQQKGDFKKRGQPHLMITHTPKNQGQKAHGETARGAEGGAEDVVSVGAGYPYLSETEVTLTIDDKRTFELFTQNDQAWAKDAATDKAIVTALQKGKSLVVAGVSQRGSTTQDRYNLHGTAQAYKSLIKGCAPGAAGKAKKASQPTPSLKDVLKKARKARQTQGKST